MPDLHHIKLLLGIKDKNIFITNVESKSIKNIKSLVVSATLSKEIRRCPLCKQMNHEGMIVKNGKKKSLIQLNKMCEPTDLSCFSETTLPLSWLPHLFYGEYLHCR